ncbi:golgin subfamily A member 6-like protein 7 isoform X2 [Gadus macrocephalus]|uniref:golgin subfamily A member 6-like protein 7 isoform X2 n=1 Tax=Gadus macrocephalus TaxID=80720 RepID=UPI0028CB3092|nr:golgin subfamily A member 6-like protein 7 isoform X2 [Gadus macrocephalus]
MSRGSTQKICPFCKGILPCAKKICSHCNMVQPIKQRLQKALSRFEEKREKWVSSRKKNHNLAQIKEEAVLMLEKLQAAGYKPVLLLGTPCKKSHTVQVFLPRCTLAPYTEESLKQMRSIHESVCQGWTPYTTGTEEVFTLSLTPWNPSPVVIEEPEEDRGTSQMEMDIEEVEERAVPVEEGAVEEGAVVEGALEVQEEAGQVEEGAVRVEEGARQLEEGAVELKEEAGQVEEGAVQVKEEEAVEVKEEEAVEVKEEEAVEVKEEEAGQVEEEEAVEVKEEAGQVEEEAGQVEEEAGQVEEEAGQVEEEAGQVEEVAVEVKEEAWRVEEAAVRVEEEAHPDMEGPAVSTVQKKRKRQELHSQKKAPRKRTLPKNCSYHIGRDAFEIRGYGKERIRKGKTEVLVEWQPCPVCGKEWAKAWQPK